MEFPKIFVLHVKSGYEDRARHIEKTMARLGLEFEYILDGDMCDLTAECLDRYFTGDMHAVTPATSCGMKHILAYERIVAGNLPGALILEDDMFLSPKFPALVMRTLAQAGDFSAGKPVWIGYEASGLKFIPRSRRKKGIHIYRADELQCTGAYYINRECARLLLDRISEDKCPTVFDWHVTRLCRETGFHLYWAHPVLAEQGSHTGRMQSSIGNGVSDGSAWGQCWVRVKRPLTTFYKKLISFFR